MNFFQKCLLVFLITFSSAYSFETNVGPSGGKGYVILDDGTRIDGLWKVERGYLTKCKNCKMKVPDRGIIESNIIANESSDSYVPSGKFKYTGDIVGNDNRRYSVIMSGNAMPISSGWTINGKVNVIYNNEESIFDVSGGVNIGDLLKEKYHSEPNIKVETKKKSTKPNKNKIELAKNECSELGIETGTEKFADCVLQLSK